MTYKRVVIVSAVFVFTMLLTGFAQQSKSVTPKKDFKDFPRRIKNWTGMDERFDDQVYDILGVDDSILINYRLPKGERVQLYVGFYGSQKEGDLIHSPKNCMPGSGWNIVGNRIERIQLSENGNEMKAILLKLQKSGKQQMVLYWFQSRGRIISSEYWQKIWLVIDSITKRRTDGSFVRLISPVTDSEQKTLDLLKSFTRMVAPHLNEYIPS